MHYYSFHIGDYASHTRHLDLLEDLAYRRLLDLYYVHERPISLDATLVAKQIGMRDHAATVRDVLNEFFERTDDGYTNARADKEIAAYRGLKEAGKRGAEKRWGQAKSTTYDSPPIATLKGNHKGGLKGGNGEANATPIATINHKPLTTNQEPKKKRAAFAAVSVPQDVDPKVWEDWLAIRKAKSLPLTETAWQEMEAERVKAGLTAEQMIRECCLRGWGAFKASWWQREVASAKPVDKRRETFDALTGNIFKGGSNVKLIGS